MNLLIPVLLYDLFNIFICYISMRSLHFCLLSFSGKPSLHLQVPYWDRVVKSPESHPTSALWLWVTRSWELCAYELVIFGKKSSKNCKHTDITKVTNIIYNKWERNKAESTSNLKPKAWVPTLNSRKYHLQKPLCSWN